MKKDRDDYDSVIIPYIYSLTNFKIFLIIYSKNIQTFPRKA